MELDGFWRRPDCRCRRRLSYRQTGPTGLPNLPGQHSTVLSQGITPLEEPTTLRFGEARRPLLVSVRSGAAVSMPGMLETVLDVGLNAATVEALIRLVGNPERQIQAIEEQPLPAPFPRSSPSPRPRLCTTRHHTGAQKSEIGDSG